MAKKGIQGILYLDRAPKFAVEAPTARPNTTANTKLISNLGSLKIILKNFLNPRRKKKLRTRYRNINASIAENAIAGEEISQGNGLKNVATRLLPASKAGFDVFIEKLEPSSTPLAARSSNTFR
ncbi:MAG: hypothetical protein BWZ05_02219 [Bacteroidetes bacterium ADurb.BinA245]|nr:MAG: hypothetical protein BWZ05_02219 [Bacteroidetes bacterium ADurb.BinA245]